VQRLRELDRVDGCNIAIEYRWADGRTERYREIAEEFVRINVDVIIVVGTPTTLAVKRATSQVPIVFVAVSDPVGTGLVAGLGRPGGNVSGLANQQSDLAGRRLQLLQEVVPGLRRLAILVNVENPASILEIGDVQIAARTLGLDGAIVGIRRAEQIAPGFDSLRSRTDALYVASDPLLNSNRVRINTLALDLRLPTLHAFREHVEAAGLVSYGPNFPDLFRRAAEYVDKALRGAKPSDLPKRGHHNPHRCSERRVATLWLAPKSRLARSRPSVRFSDSRLSYQQDAVRRAPVRATDDGRYWHTSSGRP
jgi:putative ABC transport system substrate-binding protein